MRILVHCPEQAAQHCAGSHATVLLDNGGPVHRVAARGGHDPAVLLRYYAKHTKEADKSAAATIGAIFKGAY